MAVLILGATGRTGRILLHKALERGLKVNVLVREPGNVRVSSDELRIFRGTPVNLSSVARAAVGCDAILSALNISRTSDFPWSPLRTPPNFLSQVMRNVICISAGQPIRQFVFTSAWGVAETEHDIPRWFRWIIRNSNINAAYLDHAEQEQLVKDSGLTWTAVRPAGLINSKRGKPVRVSLNNVPRPGLLISRDAVAEFMLDCLIEGKYKNQAPVISW